MLVKISSSKLCAAVCRLTVVTVLALLVVACGEEEKKPGQAIAKVDSVEITIHRLNAELGRLNPMTSLDPENADAIRANVLRKLVDQQLLVTQAQERKLDRDPDVVQGIEQAKRQIIAQAYLRKLTAAVTQPTAGDVADYYSAHPELFENRKIYTMRVVGVPRLSLSADGIAALEGFNTLTEAKVYLKEQGVSYRESTTSSPVEELPMEAVLKMLDAPDGALFFMDGAAQVSVYDIIKAEHKPMTLAQAKPLIEQFLRNQSNEKRVKGELERLRQAANIVYLGEFSGLESEDITTIEGEASSDSVDRGLSGLK